MLAKPYEWAKLNSKSCQSTNNDSYQEVLDVNNFFVEDDKTGSQGSNQINETEQISSEAIIIRDSCEIEVSSTDTQVAVSLQVAIQAAITLVINLTIADSDQAEKVTQQLLQEADIKQLNKQNLVIENSRNVNITTTDTDVAVSLQALLQVLVALVADIDIL
ncbi:spore coat protein [Metabacillus litoralis]|uniref:spore coat protein n=1 Tax=Metabacillus TaxID=2675233 RepID=UPI001B9C135C|nr:spore coat protein [Metabacillus litoralis]MCM3408382.1 spore coat protein [Metabacillus litoralis]UHA59943.1 spore coat protein [Metabacillus litoralis]